jgi:hypothetical protein
MRAGRVRAFAFWPTDETAWATKRQGRDIVNAERHAAAKHLGTEPVKRRERRPVSLHSFVLRQDGSSSEALLLDLSYDGCGIETPVALKPGESVKLSVLRRGAMDATVRWCKDGKAGLVFETQKPAVAHPRKRRSERVATTAEVQLRRLGKNGFRVSVTDLSLDGCKVGLVERPRMKEHMLVKFDGLEVLEAEVCWVDGFTAGLRFERSIHPAVFQLLVDRLQQVAPLAAA